MTCRLAQVVMRAAPSLAPPRGDNKLANINGLRLRPTTANHRRRPHRPKVFAKQILCQPLFAIYLGVAVAQVNCFVIGAPELLQGIARRATTNCSRTYVGRMYLRFYSVHRLYVFDIRGYYISLFLLLRDNETPHNATKSLPRNTYFQPTITPTYTRQPL